MNFTIQFHSIKFYLGALILYSSDKLHIGRFFYTRLKENGFFCILVLCTLLKLIDIYRPAGTVYSIKASLS